MFLKNKRTIFLTIISSVFISHVLAQQSYFIDGYHGGIWGHYPYLYSSFIAEEMDAHPNWKLNFEIEPVTWDSIEKLDPTGYSKIKNWINNDSVQTRIEYINPDYGQSYLYNISGESIIRQFKYGMKTLRKHFPKIAFTTYSSEEPCFTSALPGILKSYGFKYASLKNPNTCWAGYVAAHGGELVNWVGPDGSSILTVPRYAAEKLLAHSTWQTEAWNNSPSYIQSALNDGIKDPVGMCIQDAGWRNGPWLGEKKNIIYTTWRNYFKNIANKDNVPDWQLSQEDIKVSLVWGGQILQRVAKAVRKTENMLVNTEIIAALNKIYFGKNWPQKDLDIAWKNLLLSEHHDCWVVPYNRKYGRNWEQYVQQWTGASQNICDTILDKKNLKDQQGEAKQYIRIYNGSAQSRTAYIGVNLPTRFAQKQVFLSDKDEHRIPAQRTNNKLYFRATIPSVGYASFRINEQNGVPLKGEDIISEEKNGDYKLETDLYKIIIDPKAGGAIKSLLMKKENDHEFVIKGRFLNELKGYFYQEKRFHSGTETPATIKILSNGPLYASVQIKGIIAGNPFTQIINVTKDGAFIKMKLHIDWLSNIGIGKFDESKTYKSENLVKAFYNNKYKLLTLFPVNISDAVIYKDAPFDVFKSKEKNTFFNSWDSIKNNVLLHWVDIEDKEGRYGLALFSDETTSYAHGPGIPLGLTTQYSGRALFGADYTLDGATNLSYALLPHTGNWKKGDVNMQSAYYNRPLTVTLFKSTGLERDNWNKSFMHLDNSGCILSALMIDHKDIVMRLFNAQGKGGLHTIYLEKPAKNAVRVKLNGEVQGMIPIQDNGKAFSLRIPPLGFSTIRLEGIVD